MYLLCSTFQRVGALCGGLGRGLAKLKAVSGDSGDEWLVEPDYHHQGRLGTAGYARWAHRAAEECIKYLPTPPDHQCDTRPLNRGHYGFSQGHHRHRPSRGPWPTCRGGGWRSGCPWLGLCASCRSTTAHCSTFQCVGALCGGFGRGLVKLKATSGDSGDEWLVDPKHHHQGRLSTAGCARRGYGAAGRCKQYLLAPPVRHRTLNRGPHGFAQGYHRHRRS